MSQAEKELQGSKPAAFYVYLEYIGQKMGGAMRKASIRHNFIFCLVMVVTKRRWNVL